MSTNLDDYNFDLPEHLIAQQPANPRDAARLLVYDRQTGHITDAIFRQINDFLPLKTTLVLNNAKVDKCRLRFGSMEVFVVETVNDRVVRAMVQPGPKFRPGRTVELVEGITARVLAISDDGLRTLELNIPLNSSALEPYTFTPLPPYIAQDESLAQEYQTVYAKTEGSKAAPTAGLHFTPGLLHTIQQQHDIAEITLNVGLGTFAPLRAETIAAGHLHAETFSIDQATAEMLNQACHITAVGTTSVRTLESAAKQNNGQPLFIPTEGSTEIFIQPGYQFKAVNALVTNFHLPKTSLLMLVAAFMGFEPTMQCYAHAIKHEYRFYSFGDAMLIL